ncbi:shikimate dehydrogenase [Zhihengliuella sp.]|uniref:shikimate dehydrogenase family protein n=1 Tax=Zhihengliuella sp. TaxID=1954483 RepID=UPI002811604F|nr:shikimate dehydrogenase [Zhihengliuella sp.]
MTDETQQPRGRAAVIGNPIGHSKSPRLHAAAYRALGARIDYDAIEADPQDARTLAGRLRTEPGWRGLSCTMPMKAAMVPYMDDVSDRVRRLGVLNTVVVDDSGDRPRLLGENTDVDGIIRALAAGAPGGRDSFAGGRLAVLGAGGTASAAMEAAALLEIATVDLVVRHAGRAAGTVALARELGLAVRVLDAPAAGAALGEYDVVVSTLPPRAADPIVETLLASDPRAGAPLLDVAYDPWPSRLVEAWGSAGGRIVDGLDMLVHQAVEQALRFARADPEARALVTNVMCDAVGTPRRRG